MDMNDSFGFLPNKYWFTLIDSIYAHDVKRKCVMGIACTSTSKRHKLQFNHADDDDATTTSLSQVKKTFSPKLVAAVAKKDRKRAASSNTSIKIQSNKIMKYFDKNARCETIVSGLVADENLPPNYNDAKKTVSGQLVLENVPPANTPKLDLQKSIEDCLSFIENTDYLQR